MSFSKNISFIFFVIMFLVMDRSLAKEESPLVFSYPHFPPIIYYSPKEKIMKGEMSGFLKSCFQKISYDVETIELPVERYRLHLEQGKSHIALGNKSGKRVQRSTIMGQVPIGRSILGFVSRTPITSSYKVPNIRDSIIVTSYGYHYAGLKKRLKHPDFNNRFVQVESNIRGFELVRRKRADFFLMYLNQVEGQEVKGLIKHALLTNETFFVVSKKLKNAKEIISELDRVASLLKN